MILDSVMIDASSQRTAADSLNEFYWHGTATTSGQAARVRTLVERESITAGTAGFPLQLLHESGDPALVASRLTLLELGKGTRAWAWMQRLGDADVMRPLLFVMAFDLVVHSAFTELGYGALCRSPNNPLMIDASLTNLAERFLPFTGKSLDIRAALLGLIPPTLIISGACDIRTPREVANEFVDTAPNATLLPARNHGHSALDTAPHFALAAIDRLERPETTPDDLTSRRSAMARCLTARINLAKILPKSLS